MKVIQVDENNHYSGKEYSVTASILQRKQIAYNIIFLVLEEYICKWKRCCIWLHNVLVHM